MKRFRIEAERDQELRGDSLSIPNLLRRGDRVKIEDNMSTEEPVLGADEAMTPERTKNLLI
jgi:hypothetical protein